LLPSVQINSSTAAPAWLQLFEPPSKEQASRSFFTLSRHNHDFLFLPRDRCTAQQSIQLYPAQTTKALIARATVQFLINFGLSAFLPRQTFSVAHGSHFAGFLRSLVPGATLPDFAVLSGNPNAPGTRFILLLFNEDNTPACIVKAGTTPAARELVRRESAFLKEFRNRFAALPVLLGFSESEDYTALALPFISGASPHQNDVEGIAKLLSTWICHNEKIPLRSITAWQNLPKDDETFRKMDSLVGDQVVRPVLMHGDFAPWNIKVGKGGHWIAIDWEHGQFPGVPSWDWFHYIVQTSILVRHDSPHETLLRLQQLFALSTFKSYAKEAGITDGILGILVGYLLHNKMHGLSGDAESIDQISRLVIQRIGN
jgi:hypothetical protein